MMARPEYPKGSLAAAAERKGLVRQEQPCRLLQRVAVLRILPAQRERSRGQVSQHGVHIHKSSRHLHSRRETRSAPKLLKKPNCNHHEILARSDSQPSNASTLELR
jgi:hypothetical protein